MTTSGDALPTNNYEEILTLIKDSHQEGADLLVKTFQRGMMFLAARYNPDHAEDSVQECFMAVIKQIRAGQLSSSRSLPAYLRTTLIRIASLSRVRSARLSSECAAFEAVIEITPNSNDDPCRAFEAKQRTLALRQALKKLAPRECEILTRFYLKEQTKEEICREMNLTLTGFRLLKCASKKKLEEAATRISQGSRFGRILAIAS